MRKERKHYTAEEKVAILRRHLLDKVPVSDLCEELNLKPTVFYRRQKEFFENGAAAFQAQERPHRQVEESNNVQRTKVIVVSQMGYRPLEKAEVATHRVENPGSAAALC